MHGILLTSFVIATILATPLLGKPWKRHTIDAGSKGKDGVIGWLRSPTNPRQLADWKYETFHWYENPAR